MKNVLITGTYLALCALLVVFLIGAASDPLMLVPAAGVFVLYVFVIFFDVTSRKH